MEAARCLCCCAPEKREILSDAARMLYPEADCTFSSSAGELRSLLIQEGDRPRAAIVGFCGPGVSDINLCAAIAADGLGYDDGTMTVRIVPDVAMDTKIYYVYVTITDPTQLRTATAGAPRSKVQAKASSIAKHNNYKGERFLCQLLIWDNLL